MTHTVERCVSWTAVIVATIVLAIGSRGRCAVEARIVVSDAPQSPAGVFRRVDAAGGLAEFEVGQVGLSPAAGSSAHEALREDWADVRRSLMQDVRRVEDDTGRTFRGLHFAAAAVAGDEEGLQLAAGREGLLHSGRPRLLLFSYANRVKSMEQQRGLCQLLESVVQSRLQVEVLGWGQEWQGYAQKVLELGDRLAAGDIAEDDVVLFVDAFDVLVVDDADALLSRFLSLNTPMLFSADVNCHPWNLFSNFTCDLFPPPASGVPYRYLNSGVIVGRAWAVRQMVDLYARSSKRLYDFVRRSASLSGLQREAYPGLRGTYDQELLILMWLAGVLPAKIDTDQVFSVSFASKTWPWREETPEEEGGGFRVSSRHHAVGSAERRCCDPLDDFTVGGVPVRAGSRHLSLRTRSTPAVLHFPGSTYDSTAYDALHTEVWYAAFARGAIPASGGERPPDRSFPPLSFQEVRSRKAIRLGGELITLAEACG